MTITEFLEARIAEDEAEIRSAKPRDVDIYYDGHWIKGQASSERLLSECAAKRAIIADHAEFVEAIDKLSAALPGGLNQEPDAPWRTSTLRHLAAVYADHADFDERWAV